MKEGGKFFALGSAFVLPLTFLGSDQWGLVLYFVLSGFACLASSRISIDPRLLAAAGFACSAVACGIYLGVPDLSLVAGIAMGIGTSVANVALLDEGSRFGGVRKLLTLQAFMAAGNASPPLLVAAGISVSVLVICTGILSSFIALVLFATNKRGAAVPAVSGADLRLATCSGLATAMQLGLVLAAQQLVESADLVAAVWIGASCGIIAGRVIASAFGECFSWRAVAGLALTSAVLMQFFPAVAGSVGVALLAFACSFLIAPVFPLVLAVSYTRQEKQSTQFAVRPGPLALAVAIAMSGIVPLVLGLTGGAWAPVILSAVGLVLAVLLFHLPRYRPRGGEQRQFSVRVDN